MEYMQISVNIDELTFMSHFYFYFDILRLYLEVSDNFMMIMMIEVQKKREKINYFWLFLAHLIKPFLLMIDELHWRIIKLVQDEPEMFDLKCCEIMYCSTSRRVQLITCSSILCLLIQRALHSVQYFKVTLQYY